MSWVRLDDTFPEHPKVLQVGGDAAWLHVCALAYCNRNETDGRIPAAAVPRLSDRRKPMGLAALLVEVGLWDATDAGFVIHDYLEYQPSRASLEKKRGQARERMAKHRTSSTDVRANTERSSLNPDPTRPVPLTAAAAESSTGPAQPLAAAAAEAFIDIRVSEVKPTNERGFRRTIAASIPVEFPTLHSWCTSNPTATVAEVLDVVFNRRPVTYSVGANYAPAPLEHDPNCEHCAGSGWRTIDHDTNTVGPCPCEPHHELATVVPIRQEPTSA